MTRHFATVCKRDQLALLMRSMHRHCGDFVLHVLTWDYETFGDWFGAKFTTRADFLDRHPDLEPSRLPGPPRSAVDTVATVRWAFFANVLEATGEPLTTLDGDLFAFGQPDEIYAEIGRAGMAVIPHNIPPAARGLPGVTYETHHVYNEFNSGFTYWADVAPLRELAEAVRLWSYTEVRRHPVDGRPDFGDQGSLQRVAERYGAHVIANPAAAPGPWNVHTQPLEARDGAVFFGGRRLAFYHFSSLRWRDGALLKLADAPYEITEDQRRILYDPYLEALRESDRSDGTAVRSLDRSQAGGP